MKQSQRSFRSVRNQVLIFLVILTATSVYAQNNMQTVIADPTMVVIPVRSENEISTDLNNALDTKKLAADRNTQAVERLGQIMGAIATRKAAVEDIDNRRKNAKDANRDNDAASLEFESKANRKAIDLLERLKNLREAEVEAAKVEEDHADLKISVFQLESDLRNKRNEYNWGDNIGTGNLTQNTARQVLGELEVNLLKLQQKLASATQDVASKQKDVVNQRMKLHEAQVKLGI